MEVIDTIDAGDLDDMMEDIVYATYTAPAKDYNEGLYNTAEWMILDCYTRMYDITSVFNITDDSINVNLDIINMRAVNKNFERSFRAKFGSHYNASPIDFGMALDNLLWHRDYIDDTRKDTIVNAIMWAKDELDLPVEKRLIELIKVFIIHFYTSDFEYGKSLINALHYFGSIDDDMDAQKYRFYFLHIMCDYPKYLLMTREHRSEDINIILNHLHKYIIVKNYIVDEKMEIITDVITKARDPDVGYTEIVKMQADLFTSVLYNKMYGLYKYFKLPPVTIFLELHYYSAGHIRDLFLDFTSGRHGNKISPLPKMMIYLINIANGTAKLDDSIKHIVDHKYKLCDYLSCPDKKLNYMITNRFINYWEHKKELNDIVECMKDYHLSN